MCACARAAQTKSWTQTQGAQPGGHLHWYAANSKAYTVLQGNGKIVVSRDVTFVESRQGIAEAEKAKHPGKAKVPHLAPLSTGDEPFTCEETASETIGIDDFPSYETDSEAAEEAAQEVDPIAEETDVTSDTTNSSAQQPIDSQSETRYPQRDRKPPGQIYQAQASKVTEFEEPQTYSEALQALDAAQWKLAMDEEMASLQEKTTWTLERQPPGVRPILVKWVYKSKKDALDNVERYKARLVAKGFMQQEGVHYNEVFAPMSKHTTLRTLLALAAVEDMEAQQLGIKTAFLNGALEEAIYTEQPKEYADGGPNMVCHLRKTCMD